MRTSHTRARTRTRAKYEVDPWVVDEINRQRHQERLEYERQRRTEREREYQVPQES